MSFSDEERQGLLTVKGVGSIVIDRFEQIGIHSLTQLKEYDVKYITSAVSAMLNSTCWGNSHQAKDAVHNAIEYAKEHSKV